MSKCVTHHICDCKQEEIEKLRAENQRLRESLETLRRFHGGDGTITKEQAIKALSLSDPNRDDNQVKGGEDGEV